MSYSGQPVYIYIYTGKKSIIFEMAKKYLYLQRKFFKSLKEFFWISKNIYILIDILVAHCSAKKLLTEPAPPCGVI